MLVQYFIVAWERRLAVVHMTRPLRKIYADAVNFLQSNSVALHGFRVHEVSSNSAKYGLQPIGIVCHMIKMPFLNNIISCFLSKSTVHKNLLTVVRHILQLRVPGRWATRHRTTCPSSRSWSTSYEAANTKVGTSYCVTFAALCGACMRGLNQVHRHPRYYCS